MSVKINYTMKEPEVSYIEALHYEMEARENLVQFIMGNGMNDDSILDSAAFKRYHNEYLAYFKRFKIAQKEVGDKYANTFGEKYGSASWILDYGTRIMQITINGDVEKDDIALPEGYEFAE